MFVLIGEKERINERRKRDEIETKFFTKIKNSNTILIINYDGTTKFDSIGITIINFQCYISL